MPADSSAVEKAKTAQRLRSLPCRECSFDEALFEIVKNKLKTPLQRVGSLDDLPETSEVFEKWRAYVLKQIRLLVDEAVYRIFATENLLSGHTTVPGKRTNVLSPHHDVVSRRARDLVDQLEPSLSTADARKRITGLRVTVANVMNTVDWHRHAQVFWRMQTRA